MSVNDFMSLTPSEFASCVKIYNENRVNNLNDSHIMIYNAIVQSKSKKPFSALIKKKEVRKSNISERNKTFAFFGLIKEGGENDGK